MTLLAVLNGVAKANTGRLKPISGDPIGGGSLSGVITPTNHSGWVLANGAALSNTGIYVALYAMVGTKFGAAGTLPNLLDGIAILPKGSTNYPTVGATGGEINHVLTLAEYPSHTHLSYDNIEGGRGNNMDGYSNVDGFSNGTNPGTTKTTASRGGGGAHSNMPPYLIGGYWLVKL